VSNTPWIPRLTPVMEVEEVEVVPGINLHHLAALYSLNACILQDNPRTIPQMAEAARRAWDLADKFVEHLAGEIGHGRPDVPAAPPAAAAAAPPPEGEGGGI
jgi:hypothetical protein